ncbi:MAG: hypothetical protein ACOCWR_03080 [Oceanidesulfovibrio sp.]
MNRGDDTESITGLLAVDVGLSTGFARFDGRGRLVWHGSHNFGSAARHKRGVVHILERAGAVDWLALEGGGPLLRHWENEARRRGIEVLPYSAEEWRMELFPARERTDGGRAKEYARSVADRLIARDGSAGPRETRFDAAEAICLGVAACLATGLLAEPAPGIFS